MEQDSREILLRSSNVENEDENHHELLRHSGRIKRGKLSQRWKEFESDLGEGMWLMESILTSHFEKNLGIAPEKLEESGKILGKDLWVRAHSKENTIEMITWKGDCTGWIKWLEWGNNLEIVRIDAEWKHESSEISSALRNNWIASGEWLRDTPAYTNTWNKEDNMINIENLTWIHRRRKKNEEWWTWNSWPYSWEITG